MNRKDSLIFIFAASISLSFVHPTYDHVRFVYDGDTILLDSGKKVRYVGIDAPEIGYEGNESEFLAIASRDFNRHLVGKKRVRLEFDRKRSDPHGRLLAYVFLENGDMVNALLVRHGLSRVMVRRPNLKYFSLLLNHQRLAMAEKLGIWSGKEVKTERHYLGSIKSYRFHRPACAFAGQIQPQNLVIYKNRREAFWEGFSPCKRCRP